MYYHNVLITILGFMKGIADEDVHRNADSCKDAAETCLSLSRQIAKLMNLHRSFWGIDIFQACYIQWITISLFTLLKDLDRAANREAFTSLTIAAKAAWRRWPLGKGMLRAIQLTARKMAVDLPAETDALFSYFETENWSSKDRKGLSS